jgi:hypothetical protein
MRITRSAARLELRDRVAPFRILGALFVLGGGLAVVLSLGWASNVATLEPWQRLVSLGIGVVVTASGIWWLGINPATHTAIDRDRRQLQVTRSGIAGRSVRRAGFDDLEAACIEYGHDSDGDAVCRPAVRLRGGELLRLSELWSHDSDAVRESVAAVAEATGAPMRV